ncbi:acetylornithine deacetylase [Herbaspirillum frisingense]|uniref:acetylornithine deacetylase n=1 Tax=Herbaspirillum frisingense TaxID=92645 RepID=UPI0015FFB0CE|nr:acetylornithine deacetylase [Herbaspirillum frisingense]QNB06144.1 acetylornithine deacetylase [Herbaspirillum frisingense]
MSSTNSTFSVTGPAELLRRPDQQTLAILRELIAFDTVSRHSNLQMIDFIQDYLHQRHINARITFDDEHRKANLFATVGHGSRPGIILSGHTDVVPVDGQDWSSDPFVLTERDGRFHGRGACDMKAFIAIALAKVDAMLEADSSIPFHLAFSYDEEVGCLGVHRLLADLAQRKLSVLGCIVGEPTNMQMKTGHKGKRAFRCQVTGRSAHSSTPHAAVNAIEYSSELLAFLRAQSRELEQGPRDPRFDVPYTTLTTTMFNAGIATNTIPADSEFVFEYRYLPVQDPAPIDQRIRHFIETVLLPDMREKAAESTIELLPCIDYPALETPEGAQIQKIVAARAMPGEQSKVGFGTEAGIFGKHGIESVICGPGDINHAHRPDEFVTAQQLVLCEDFIGNLITDVAALKR